MNNVKPVTITLTEWLDKMDYSDYMVHKNEKHIRIDLNENYTNPATISILEKEANMECYSIKSNDNCLELKFDPDREP